jgi:hypothetical protein
MYDGPDKRFLITWGFPAEAGDQGIATDGPNHLSDLLLGDREHPDGNITEELHQCASDTKGDDLSKRTVSLSTDDEFQPLGHLLLHNHPFKAGVGTPFGNGIHQGGVCLRKHCLIGNSHDDTASIAFMNDIG